MGLSVIALIALNELDLCPRRRGRGHEGGALKMKKRRGLVRLHGKGGKVNELPCEHVHVMMQRRALDAGIRTKFIEANALESEIWTSS